MKSFDKKFIEFPYRKNLAREDQKGEGWTRLGASLL